MNESTIDDPYDFTDGKDHLFRKHGFGYKDDDLRLDSITLHSRSKSRDSTFGGISTNSFSSGDKDARPMTAISGAGYQSRSAGDSLDNHGMSSIQPVSTKSPHIVSKDLAERVHQTIEESAILCQKGDSFNALEYAKKAQKKARAFLRHREVNLLPITPQCQALLCGCLFHLATMFDLNAMPSEALETYSSLLKEKAYRHCIVNIRVNMGNIYYKQEDYVQAVKMFTMALDRVPRSEGHTILSIRKSIGNAFTKMGKVRDAIRNYETGNHTTNLQSCFNLLLCYVLLGDADGAKIILLKIINAEDEEYDSPLEGSDVDFDEIDINNTTTHERIMRNDLLGFEVDARRKQRLLLIHTASRLVCHMHKDSKWIDGYKYVQKQLQTKHSFIALKIENEMAIEHLHRNELEAAVLILRSYEKKDAAFRAMAAVNLCFIYSMEGKNDIALDYADMAVETNRYSSAALVNRGNQSFIRQEYKEARKLYLEAIKHHPDCVEGIYNLGLVNMRLEYINESFEALERLHRLIPNEPLDDVLFQICNLNEEQKKVDDAIKWFHVLSTSLPTDPSVLSRLGNILKEDSQCFHYMYESYRVYHTSLEVVAWIAAWCVKHEMYEKAAYFFDLAAQIQPREVKWKLMLADCKKEGLHEV